MKLPTVMLSLVALTLLVMLSPGCGTECGNPTCIGLTTLGNPDDLFGDPDIETPFGTSAALSGFSGNSLSFREVNSSYELSYPDSWSATQTTDTLAQLSNDQDPLSSTLDITTQTLSEAIDDLLAFAQTTQPDFNWTRFATETTEGVFSASFDPTNDTTTFKLLLTNDLLLFEIDIVSREFADGTIDVNFIMNTLTLTDPVTGSTSVGGLQ